MDNASDLGTLRGHSFGRCARHFGHDAVVAQAAAIGDAGEQATQTDRVQVNHPRPSQSHSRR